MIVEDTHILSLSKSKRFGYGVIRWDCSETKLYKKSRKGSSENRGKKKRKKGKGNFKQRSGNMKRKKKKKKKTNKEMNKQKERKRNPKKPQLYFHVF